MSNKLIDNVTCYMDNRDIRVFQQTSPKPNEPDPNPTESDNHGWEYSAEETKQPNWWGEGSILIRQLTELGSR